ncbi:MAG: proton-conducting transporter membrane subunit [Bryobacteraceae bacterium]
MALIAILAIPLLAALLCWVRPLRSFAWGITVASTWTAFALAVYLSAEVIASKRVVGVPGWFEADGLTALMLVLVSFVLALASVFAGGYMRHGEHQESRLWWFYSNYNLLAFALLAVPSLAEPNMVWVAVELITLFTVLLVGFDNTSGALEAAWKFAVLTMMGAPISLFGFFTLFWAYRSATGGSWETWEGLRTAASAMDPNLLKLSFLLVFVGFGAKSGLAPMHTWLPDAHSQAPTPVCAVLSGVKTTVPLYVILRFLSIVLASPAARLGNWMVVLGLISVGIAAFLLLQVRDYKRMFAFSTVEHMGVILTAAGLATQTSDFGAVSQMLNHAITKSLCFYVAGVILLVLGTREIQSVRGLFRISPFAGSMLLLCSLAIAGAPPFPIFLSEFSILSAGMRGGQYTAVAILAILIVIAFVAIMLHVNGMVFGKPATLRLTKALPASCRFAVLVAAAPVVLLGVYIPAPVHDLLQLAAQQLGGR